MPSRSISRFKFTPVLGADVLAIADGKISLLQLY